MPSTVTPVSELTTENSQNNTFLDSEFRYTLFPAFYGVVFIIGLVANAYVLYVLRQMRGSRSMNEMRIYMTNLTVADLLFVCVLPLWISYYSHHGDWIYPDALCRISGTLFFINTYGSVLFLAVISVNRYWAVTRPLVAASTDCWRRGVITSVIIWAITLAVAAYHLATPGVQKDKHGGVSRCLEGYHNSDPKSKLPVVITNFIIIGLFFTVFLLVVLCNVLIACALLAQPVSQPRPSTGRRPLGTKRRALRMLCAVVGVFVICFVPHHVVQGPWTLAVLKMTDWSEETQQYLNDAHQVTLLLMGLNCILDPIVYCFSTRKFRLYIKGHLKKVKQGKNCSHHTSTTGLSMKIRNQSEDLSIFEQKE
ncbi:platelet-activating factor receptor-like [Clarias gariepinus]|uniref:platelet-activating factor receptor-like n=1 Tax=Clarias gariepinus TaxID=13013 RepID=UPI00234E2D7F|nr:platelet-activating factor receptor-like [Clarias gariepinus]